MKEANYVILSYYKHISGLEIIHLYIYGYILIYSLGKLHQEIAEKQGGIKKSPFNL